jgi:hypothetical protein
VSLADFKDVRQLNLGLCRVREKTPDLSSLALIAASIGVGLDACKDKTMEQITREQQLQALLWSFYWKLRLKSEELWHREITESVEPMVAPHVILTEALAAVLEDEKVAKFAKELDENL